MKYDKDLCDKLGIKVSLIVDTQSYLEIRHDCDYNYVEGQIFPFVYYLSPNDIEDLKNNFNMYSYIIDNIIDKHLRARIKYIKNIRKKKLEKINEI